MTDRPQLPKEISDNSLFSKNDFNCILKESSKTNDWGSQRKCWLLLHKDTLIINLKCTFETICYSTDQNQNDLYTCYMAKVSTNGIKNVTNTVRCNSIHGRKVSPLILLAEW